MATGTAQPMENQPSHEGQGENDIEKPPPTDSLQMLAQDSQEPALRVEYPSTLRQVLITIALMLGIFLVGIFYL